MHKKKQPLHSSTVSVFYVLHVDFRSRQNGPEPPFVRRYKYLLYILIAYRCAEIVWKPFMFYYYYLNLGRHDVKLAQYKHVVTFYTDAITYAIMYR